MISFFTELDQALFHIVNGNMSNALFDYIMPVIRNKLFWVPFYLLFILWLFLRFKAAALVIILGSAALIGISDTLSSQVIKKNVKRTRPCKQFKEKQIKILVDCGSGYSFTSSHATNHFALGAFLIFIFSGYVKSFRLLWLWAGSIAFAQVYVGVHFPLDVLAGAFLGTVIAWALYKLMRKFNLFRSVEDYFLNQKNFA